MIILIFQSMHALQFSNQSISRMLQNFYIRYCCVSLWQGFQYALNVIFYLNVMQILYDQGFRKTNFVKFKIV